MSQYLTWYLRAFQGSGRQTCLEMEKKVSEIKGRVSNRRTQHNNKFYNIYYSKHIIRIV
jgi:hypothetical protein